MESKKVEFFNKLSFITLVATIVLSFFFFIPYIPVTLEASKGFLISVGVTLAVFFWLIARLGEGKFSFPKDKLLLFGVAIPVVFLISSFFSSSWYVSLFGSGFEVGTFGSMLILFIMLFLSSLYFQTDKRVWFFLKMIFLSGIILSVFELVNIFIGFNKILPGMLSGVSSGNLVGNWNNFALIFGLIVILSIFSLEFLKLNKKYNIALYFLLISGLFFLILVNSPLVWTLVGIFSVIIFVYSVSIQHAGYNIVHGGGDKKKFPFIALISVFICFIFLVSSNSLGALISRFVNLSNTDVRPSITTTAEIAYKSIKHNPFFGTGPNTFSIDWSLWHPKQINNTIFWNTDFTNGYSLLFTFFVSTGILGIIACLAFLVAFVMRAIKSLRIAIKDPLSNYFVISVLTIAIYSWITVIIYNPSIVLTMLAFVSTGVFISVLISRGSVKMKEFSFLNDPRNSFFAILGLMALMIVTVSVTYLYIEKFSSVIYYSNSLDADTTSIDSLAKSERMLIRAISLDKNDVYYRTLSQVYISEIGLLVNNKDIPEETLKSNLQTLINNAQTSASSAVSQNQKQYKNHMNLGNIYSSLVSLSVENSYESAMSAYDKAFELSPNNPSIILAKANLEIVNKKNDEARKYIKQALELKNDYTDAIFTLAQIESSEGNTAGAIKQAEYAATVAPNDETVFFRLGLLRFNNNEFSKAVSAFENAVIINPNYMNARFFLGQAYAKSGRKGDALVQFRILEKVLPDNQEVKNAISTLDKTASTANTETTDKEGDSTDTTKEVNTKDTKALPSKQ